MTEDSDELADLLHRAADGDQEALRALLTRYQDRLKRMVHLRLSRRLAGRVDDSDVPLAHPRPRGILNRSRHEHRKPSIADPDGHVAGGGRA
jgi:2-polyprenyl-6-methoxyphenol hydroxylase-like FAD-dependent oxidoreductase